ncbi:hypothetical protein [Pseudomonas sp. R5-89-07]|uniref:hypothetical protein n=1 Tax=Pseudomonas sp. R5-89-07 TaxID=658644 RepID=UPI000F55CE32|nr:hypothetical protein [Pseudomonas sp. R5-89-07]
MSSLLLTLQELNCGYKPLRPLQNSSRQEENTMLTSSHSLPTLQAASRALGLSENDNPPEKKSNLPNASVFAYNTRSATLAMDNSAKNRINETPIAIERNPRWVNPETRSACKYSPVKVGDLPHDDAINSPRKASINSMRAVLDNRIDTCRELSMDRGTSRGGSWFSFLRGALRHEPHLNKETVPAVVISGGKCQQTRCGSQHGLQPGVASEEYD